MSKIDVKINNRIPSEAKFKVFMYKYSKQIVLLLVGMLLMFMFVLGAKYSCTGGYMQGLTCVSPKEIGTIRVCELNTINCQENCQNFFVNNVSALMDEYGNKLEVS